MARLEDRSLGRLYVALIAAGAVAGGLVAAGTLPRRLGAREADVKANLPPVVDWFVNPSPLTESSP
jgi:hypothetical protein